MKVEGEIRAKKFQSLPKKLLRSQRIKISDPVVKDGPPYEMSATLWIPDIPYSKNPPKIGLTLTHGPSDRRQNFRLIFTEVEDILNAVDDLRDFVSENALDLIKTLTRALEEWEEMKRKINEDHESKVLKEARVRADDSQTNLPSK